MKITPNNQTLSPNGLTISNLQVKVLDHAAIEERTIPIKATILFPRIGVANFIPNNLNQSINANTYYLTLTISPPLSIQQRISNFVADWITPIGGLWTFLAGVSAVVIPLILRMYKTKQKKHKRLDQYFKS